MFVCISVDKAIKQCIIFFFKNHSFDLLYFTFIVLLILSFLDHREAPRLQPGITQLPELLHLAIGFQSSEYTEQDMFAFAVLNMLLGCYNNILDFCFVFTIT